MKRLGLIPVLIICIILSGCQPIVEPDEKISLYATFYPIYALTDRIMDGVPDAELHCLVQPQDGCFRKYQLSDWDIYLLGSSADGIIMGGRGLESFESTLFSLEESGPAVSAVLYNLDLYNQDEKDASDEDASHLIGANPHLYMSVEGAKLISESIAATLMSFDPDYSEKYSENAEKMASELDALKAQMLDIAGNIAGEPVILMNEALIYTAQDYGFEISEWFDRESGEALYDTALEDCIETLSDSEARVILIEKQAPQAFVAALEKAGFSVAKIDILSTHREQEGFNGYIQAQLSNAKAIRSAFDRIQE